MKSSRRSFAYREDYWKEDLYKIGFYLGKYIYLLDAYEDIEDDLKTGAYNPFKALYQEEQFEEQVLNLLLDDRRVYGRV